MIGFISAWRLKKIYEKTYSGMMGFSPDEEDPIASGDDEFWGAEHKSEGGGHSPFLEDLVGFDDEGIPIAVPVGLPTLPVPSPLRRSPRRFFQSSTNATGEVDAQPPAAHGAPPRRNNSTKGRTPLTMHNDVIHNAIMHG